MSYKVKLSLLLFSFLLLIPLMASADHDEEAVSVRSDIVGVMLSGEDRSERTTGAIRVIDYGSFQWAVYPANARAARTANAINYDLMLGGGVVSTSSSADADRDSAWVPARESDQDSYLVQLIGPTKDTWRNEIEAAGLDVVQYIFPFTYVVFGSSDAVAAIDSADFVRWTGPFKTDYRVLPQYRSTRNAETVAYRIIIFNGADEAAIQAEIAELVGDEIIFGRINDTWSATTINLTDETLAAIAPIPGVFSIQSVPTDGGPRGEMSNQFIARNIDATGQIQTGYAAWLAEVGVTGNGVIMANVDGGIQDDHPALASRMLPCVGSTCGLGISDSHGTHTAGIMAADGSTGVLLNGFIRGIGVAPGANLVEQRYSPTYTLSNGMLILMQQSVQNNAVISGNSWGPAGVPRGYDNDTMQVDIGVRDADSATAGNQQLSYMLSFMNGYGGISTQGSPDEAKNIFTIGSTSIQSSNGMQLSDIDRLSANSAHGPANDGRTIPHMVAPGCQVDSTITGSGYGFKCGTSMASPHVAGGAGLFFEKYRDLNGTDPSPALVKAAFTVTADSLEGELDADGGTLGHPFDSKQGWGSFNLREVISPTLPMVFLDQTVLLTQTGDTYDFSIEAVDPTRPIRMMLTWTDAPGAGLGGNSQAWVNDLNLSAEHASQIYHGNQFAGDGWSQASATGFDNRNNTEGIFLPSASMPIDVTVSAANLAGDGLPGNGNAIDQDFAFACYNCKLATSTSTNVSLTLQDAVTPLNSAGLLAGVVAGSILTYTVVRTVTVSDTQEIATTLISTPPAGTQVLSNTIQVDGVAAPQYYNAERERVEVQTSAETVPTADDLTLTYQVKIQTAQPEGSTYTWQTNSWIDARFSQGNFTTLLRHSASIERTVAVTDLTIYRYYFPIFFKAPLVD